MWCGAGLGLAVAAVLICAQPAVKAQDPVTLLADESRVAKDHVLRDRLPDKPSQAAAFTIPVEPLGFSSPSADYLGQRWSFVSLDFLDENRLLFTFRVPGLLRRDPGDNDKRQIRAVVLSLPAGTVQAEALWSVHDRARYLWMLKDGHFLLRDRDNLEQGDATLELKPYLRFQGPLLWLGMDPTQQLLVTNSREPATAAAKIGDVPSPTTAQADVIADGPQQAGDPDLVLRILRRDSGKVMLVSRVRSMIHLPINSDGYLEGLRGNGEKWLLNLNYFSGGSRILCRFDSKCAPTYEFVSEREVLVTACVGSGAGGLVAMSTDGRRLWQDLTSVASVWPLIVHSQGGSRLARETLAANRAISATSPLDSDEVKGQLIRVFDAATGTVALEAPASPALDAGGNVAISPSGRRVAILNAGAIQVFELPPAPALPEAPATKAH
ncbi:MAG: hypothetical protein ABR956_04065 [Terracidiphilus sp.]